MLCPTIDVRNKAREKLNEASTWNHLESLGITWNHLESHDHMKMPDVEDKRLHRTHYLVNNEIDSKRTVLRSSI